MHSGKIIRLLREAEGISQQDLADRLHVARTYLSQLENAKRQPSMALLKEVAALFRIPVALLLLEGPAEHKSILGHLQEVLTYVLEAKRKNRRERLSQAQNASTIGHSNNRAFGARAEEQPRRTHEIRGIV